MKPELYRHFRCYSTNKVTFLLYNLAGEIVGYQHYRPGRDKERKNDPKAGRYYTHLPKGKIGLFGLEVLNPADKRLFVVEGIFKAATLHRLGYNAIAALTANPKPLAALFRTLRGSWRVLGLGDGDKAGGQLVEIVGHGACSLIDVDEMNDADLVEFLECF